MERVDFVIVGQGLAGTTLAWQLLRRGRSVLVIDREGGVTSSRIAAGLITPVTGKRLAKSWRWEELYPAAVAFYRSLEAEIRVLLRDLVQRGAEASLRELADRIAAMTPKVPQTDSTELIREDRAR